MRDEEMSHVQVMLSLYGIGLAASLFTGTSVTNVVLDHTDARLTIAAAVLILGVLQACTSWGGSRTKRLIVCAGESAIWCVFLGLLWAEQAFVPSFFNAVVSLGANLWLCFALLKDPP